MPASADAVIIGGGVIGVTAAHFLARAGLKTVLLEKGRIAAEQSSRNWGWVRAQGRDAAELPLMLEARRLWRSLAAESGEDIGLAETGVLYLADTDKDMAAYADWQVIARAHDLDTRLLTAAETAAMIPASARRWKGGLWTPSDMRAEPWAAVPALARLAARQGVMIRESAAVRRLDLAAGRVTGVITEHGRIESPLVLLAAGAWSGLFLARHGISLPQLSVRATVMRTAPLPEIFAGQAVDGELAFRRRQDGGYTLAPASGHGVTLGPSAFRHLRAWLPALPQALAHARIQLASPKGFPDAWGLKRSQDAPSPFESMRILDPAPRMREIAKARARFAERFPALGAPEITHAWAGMIDTLPDVVPVAGPAPLDGLFVATGMSGHGFGIGPAFGRVMADLMRGRPAGHDMGRFRFSRFSDGSKLAPGPSL